MKSLAISQTVASILIVRIRYFQNVNRRMLGGFNKLEYPLHALGVPFTGNCPESRKQKMTPLDYADTVSDPAKPPQEMSFHNHKTRIF
ncbi:MAG: hypothetical protein LKJ44_01445 [Bifidobacteriaceae bacterium]|jgi:hypothetical protein|nr:hypothetical protein [Bifidobacteriaceae bacterium]